jgi:hypothetical protein
MRGVLRLLQWWEGKRHDTFASIADSHIKTQNLCTVISKNTTKI